MPEEEKLDEGRRMQEMVGGAEEKKRSFIRHPYFQRIVVGLIVTLTVVAPIMEVIESAFAQEREERRSYRSRGEGRSYVTQRRVVTSRRPVVRRQVVTSHDYVTRRRVISGTRYVTRRHVVTRYRTVLGRELR